MSVVDLKNWEEKAEGALYLAAGLYHGEAAKVLFEDHGVARRRRERASCPTQMPLCAFLS